MVIHWDQRGIQVIFHVIAVIIQYMCIMRL